MKHILTILIMMLALGIIVMICIIICREDGYDDFTCREIMGEPDS